VVCNTGVGLTPRIEDSVHHFSAGGLYNGLVLLIDDETRTYWDHITGEAVHGPLRGAKLDIWGIEITTPEAAIEAYPGLTVLQNKPDLRVRAITWFMGVPFLKGRLPPGFRRTMGEGDHRLPEMEMGLGVTAGKTQRFYTMKVARQGIDDELDGRPIRIDVDEASGIPRARWTDGTRPFQLFSRWYGFAYTFPGCEIYGTEVVSV
jgi:hypothetical protein